MPLSPRRLMIAPLLLCAGLALPAQVPGGQSSLPGGLQGALQAMQAGQQAPGQPGAPAAQASATDTSASSAQIGMQQVNGQDPTAQAQMLKELAKQIAQLRAAYKGPFVLGSDLFNLPADRLPPPAQAAVSDDYQLGAGDQLMLYVYGSATFEAPLVIDRRGDIAVPKVGTVHVAGQSLGNARSTVTALVRRNFSNTTVDLQFQKIRDVRVYVLGEVYVPGAYVMPSLTSLVAALTYSGGPSAAGSYRDIRVIRDGKVLQDVDLYPLRLEGMGAGNLQLKDGDAIFVPLTGVRVLMDGEFVRTAMAPVNKDFPGVMVELKPSETAWEAFTYIGGLLPTAYPSLVTLERHLPAGVTEVKNLSADQASLSKVPVFTTDIMRAMPRVDPAKDLLTVGGHVRVPGTFAFRQGMKVKEALLDPGQILPDTYLGRGQIVRTRDDLSTEMLSFDVAKALQGDPANDLALSPRDSIELYSVDDLRLPRRVTVLGPFTHPGDFDWHDHMRASDLIFQAGVPRLSANRYYAELAHMQPGGKPGPVVQLDLQKLLFTESDTAAGLRDATVNPELQPYDQITLYELPDFKIHKTVTLSGQVARPGPYVLESDRVTLSQVIARAGGLTENAMPSAGIFLRSSLNARDLTADQLKAAGTKDDPTLHNVDEVLDRLNERKLNKLDGRLLQNPILHGLATGALNRMVVDFSDALTGKEKWDVELQDGDQIIIPRKVDTAYIVGEVASPFASFRVQDGVTVRKLIGWAGGLTRNADSWNVRLLKADGRILDSWVMRKDVEPGDVVLVPQKFRPLTSWQDNLQALTPLAILLTAIRPSGGF
jgi:protein involved in polysaccharide export with SLBB domain